MPFQIIRNDITKVKADAIVNSANPKPTYAYGTDAAIYKAAGAEILLKERKKIGDIASGDVAVTPAFALKAKYIIHTVGPSWEGGDKGEFDILRNCYANSLNKARELGCKSIAFPLIATGVYGFPKAQALTIAVNEISTFLMRDDVEMIVKLVVFDDKAFRLSENLFFSVESFINDKEVIKAHKEEYGLDSTEFDRKAMLARIQPQENSHDISVSKNETLKPFDEYTYDKSRYMNDGRDEHPFTDKLIEILNKKDIDNITAYKRSNVTKKAFSKIMCGDTKNPQKKTVLAFCIGLKLSLEEANELLASADMAFNPYNKRDKLVVDCIKRKQYDIDKVNQMLFICNQPELGNYDAGQ